MKTRAAPLHVVLAVEANELALVLDEADADRSLWAQLQTTRTLAERARDARDPREAADAVASTAAACGACHAAKGGPHPSSASPSSGATAVGALAQKVHELGAAAKAADVTSARVEVMGELLATCGACHERLGVP